MAFSKQDIEDAKERRRLAKRKQEYQNRIAKRTPAQHEKEKAARRKPFNQTSEDRLRMGREASKRWRDNNLEKNRKKAHKYAQLARDRNPELQARRHKRNNQNWKNRNPETVKATIARVAEQRRNVVRRVTVLSHCLAKQRGIIIFKNDPIRKIFREHIQEQDRVRRLKARFLASRRPSTRPRK